MSKIKRPQCECCDEEFDGEPVSSEETGYRVFCCDECMLEAADQLRIGEIEAKREAEIWGDDYDSWYR